MDESEPTSTVPTKPTSTQPGGDVDIHTPATNGSSYADSPVVEGSYFKRTFSSLANIEFRFLWIGSLLTMGAMQMQTFARGFFVYDLTDSGLLLGVVSAGAGAPGLLLSLYGGVLVDRLEKKRIIQTCQVAFTMLSLIVAILILTDNIRWQHLLIASFIHGSIMPFMMPARQAIVPQVVAKEKIMNASALNSLAMSVMSMLAPALAGGFAAWIGMANLYFIITGLYIASWVVTGKLSRHSAVASRTGKSALSDIAQGFRYVRKDNVILLLLVMGFVQVMMMAPIRFVMPIFAKDVFTVGADGLGWLLGLMGAGSLVGALLIAGMNKIHRRGYLLIVSGVFSGFILIGFSALSEFAPFLLPALVFMVIIGAIQSGRMTLQNSLTLEYVEPAYRGRVMAIQGLTWGLMPIGVLPLTIIADHWGAPIGLALLAGIFIIISVSMLAFSPKMRALH
jgi:MFS family permease